MSKFDSDTILEFGTARENEERRDGGCAVVFDPTAQRYAVGYQHNNGLLRLFGGGVEKGENIKDGILRELAEESGLCDYLRIEKIAEASAHYHNSLKNVNRVAYVTCLLVILGSLRLIETKLEPHEQFSLVWATAEDILENWRLRNGTKDYDHWIYFMEIAVEQVAQKEYNAI